MEKYEMVGFDNSNGEVMSSKKEILASMPAQVQQFYMQIPV